ncbi:MAG: DEAD/DEAH box helicase family protein [Erysipelotrichales bacterium]|nr:DEAD/DEAH box helicase family protein [Erysipelotrichales bacterium]
MNAIKVNTVNSKAEDLFVQLFCETFGPDKAENLYIQYPFVDIYGQRRYIDFALENQDIRVAIEIDGETYHNPKNVSDNKYYDDLLKQNSLVYNEWKIYRWAYNQLLKQPEMVKDELVTYLGETPFLKKFEEFLPNQQGKVFELRKYQQEAIDNLKSMRENGETIALLYHATGVGKTVTACTDAKTVNGRTLFLVNALKLADQAEKTFAKIWPEAIRGFYTGNAKDKNVDVLFATVQSISKNLIEFLPNSFDYIVIDECHHSASKTYQKIFSYFKPKFILGLTATPERSDGEDMLQLFQNVAHKMDLKTAVEKGILAPIRCIRIKTDIDFSNVRINGVKYNSQDLESKLFIPERNCLIADTYINYVNERKAVIFCASISHATEIAKLLCERGVNAKSVSGNDKVEVRNKILEDYEHGSINVLCACDLLNEGWDSPRTEVLFMARPTMSKTIYMQQLGRGTRKCEGKEDLIVFDFVDNSNMFNAPYSLHRLLNVAEYHPLEYVLAPFDKRQLDKNMLYKGEKPTIYLDIPIDVKDFEMIDLFNWQDEVKNMVSQIELLRMINVQKTTLNRYLKEKKVVPDIEIPLSESKSFKYFRRETIKKYADEYKWKIITSSNIKDIFMEYVENMDMVLSYKPVLLKAMFNYCADDGTVGIEDIVDFYIEFYENRREKGLFVESNKSLFSKTDYTRKDVEKLIFRYPFDVMSQMNFVKRDKNIELVKFNLDVFKKLTNNEKNWIVTKCDEKLEEYYSRKNINR